MACSINTLSKMRKTLREGLKASLIDPEITTANGTSGKFIHAFMNDLDSGIRNPEVVESKIKDFIRAQESPFYRKIVNEMGDILSVDIDGKTEEHFLLGVSTRRNTVTPGGIEAVLKLAPTSDINNTKSMIVNMASDTGREGLDTINGTIEGISDAIKKGVETVRNLRKMSTTEYTDPDAGGDKKIRKILDKMQDSDEILGSRQERKAESLIGYEQVKDYKHGDIGSMKKILMKLHTLGGSRADKATLAYYSKLLDSMHQRFFNKVDLYYKKNQADSFGYVNLNLGQMKIDVASRTSKGIYQSEAEVYMHEVIHTMTAWALRQDMVSVTGLRTELNRVMKEALEKTKWTDLLGKPVEEASEREKNNAKSLHDYMFASKNSADEFLAIALTNPQAIRHFKSINTKAAKREAKTILDRMFNAVANLFNLVLSKLNLKDDNLDVFTQVHNLTFKLAEVNQNNMDKLDKLNPLGKMAELLESSERTLADIIDKFFDKVKSKNPKINVPAPGASAIEKAKFFLDFSVKMFTSRAYRGYLGMWANMFGIKAGGTIREIGAGLFEKDDVMRVVEKLDLLSTNAQAARNNVISANSRAILESFNKEMTDSEEAAITTVLLETNASHLRYNRGGAKKYENRELVKLLTSKEYRYEREGRIKADIKKTLGNDEGRANWSIAQAMGLGYFMATGNGHSRSTTNARQIVIGFGSNERYSFNKRLENQLNELASIAALNYVSNSDKKLVAELIRTEPKGIDTVTNMYESYKANSANTIFKNNEAAMITGHVKEQFDQTIDIKIAPIKDKAEMEAQGYKLRYNVKPHSKVREEVPMAVYTTESWGRAERRAGIIELGGLHARGSKLSALRYQADPILGKLHFERDLAIMLADGVSTDIAMREGTFDGARVEKGVLPVYNRAGQIVDFRYTMSKENKRELFKQDLKVSEVLPRSIASVEYQIRTDELNKAALSAIKDDMRNNWKEGPVGEDSYSGYTLIGPNVLDDKNKELFYMLPETVRNFITSRKDQTLAVRDDLAGIYFGGKQLQISNMVGVNQLPAVFKHSINVMQGIWEELIKISKGAILLKMPVVLTVNLISNILYQVATGHVDIPQLVKDYKDSFKEVNEYLNLSRQINKLSYEIDRDVRALARVKNTSKLKEIIGQKKTKLSMLQRQQVNNPARELFDAGLYQSYLEDTQNTAMQESNRIVKGINNQLDRLPKPLRYVAEVSYMTQNTAWYKASQELLQRSDMVTRLVDKKRYQREDRLMAEGKKMLPRWWIKQKGKEYKSTQKLEGKEREEFFKQSQKIRYHSLVDNYINYTLPNGNFEEFLNRMGVLMFTKYLKRIQRVIGTAAVTNPIKTTAMILTAGNLMDASLVQDSAFVAKVLGSNGEISISNLVPVYSPLYHIGNVFTPAIIKDEMLGSAF